MCSLINLFPFLSILYLFLEQYAFTSAQTQTSKSWHVDFVFSKKWKKVYINSLNRFVPSFLHKVCGSSKSWYWVRFFWKTKRHHIWNWDILMELHLQNNSKILYLEIWIIPVGLHLQNDSKMTSICTLFLCLVCFSLGQTILVTWLEWV